MRKTKIVCTIGPASSSEEVFAEMCKAGLNVARLNFSHGTHEEHQQKFDMIHKVRKALGLPIAIMLDTKGPEYRICTFKNKKILLQDGDAFTFTTRQVEGDETIVGVSYAGLANDLSVGDTVLVNNGLVIFTVERIEGTEIHCRVVVGGELSDRKSMSFPHKVLEQVYLSEQDKDDLLFGIRNGIDFVAASFVSRRQDVLDVRNFLDANGGAAGILKSDFVYQKADENLDKQFIPKGSLVFTGSYKGNPAYNVVVLYDENGNVVGGVNADGSTVASQIIMAPEPGDAMLGDVSEGSWVYWIEPGDLASMKLPKQVRAELYRVDNALTNEGQRLVSDSLPGDVPDNLPDVELGGNATVAAD